MQISSTYSDAWLDHTQRYMEPTTARFGPGPMSRVIESGSNDGYLLQFFLQWGVPLSEPTRRLTVATAAEARGVPTLVKFFGVEMARELAAKHPRRPCS